MLRVLFSLLLLMALALLSRPSHALAAAKADHYDLEHVGLGHLHAGHHHWDAFISKIANSHGRDQLRPTRLKADRCPADALSQRTLKPPTPFGDLWCRYSFKTSGSLPLSDGPFTAEGWRQKCVGRVTGIKPVARQGGA